jgi:hypothetical protein
MFQSEDQRPEEREELCKTFVLYRQSKGLDTTTLSEDRYISKRLQKHLGGYMAHKLGIAEIRSFLDTAKTSDSLEHKLYKVGSPRNPSLLSVELPDSSNRSDRQHRSVTRAGDQVA